MKIWERHFLKEYCSIFFYVLLCLYGGYVAIDAASHSNVFEQSQLRHVFFYYLYHFAKRAEIFVPLALMIATIKLLSSWNRGFELLVLQCGGMSKKRIVLPIVVCALVSQLALYVNYEYVHPRALSFIREFEEHGSKSKRAERKTAAHSVSFDDDSVLIFAKYEPSERCLRDVFWLKNADEIIRADALWPYETPPIAKNVDFMSRNPAQELLLTCHEDMTVFHFLSFDAQKLSENILPFEEQPLLFLASQIHPSNSLLAMLYTKLALPFACPLAALAPCFICMCYSRKSAIGLRYALGIFLLLAFFTMMDAALVLGESGVMSPFLAIVVATGGFFAYSTKQYLKL